ncbi:MAG: NAD-dependent epimerase/dehydratase family protein [Vicinamibacterales bacterium]|nr:NAD-dependent epimerase/dehydratase family protein [Vicinamibacterales bacterium]
MALDRRSFLKASAMAGGALGLPGAATARASLTREVEQAAGTAAPGKPLRILILGGTGFIGPHQVEYALARGHQVTLLNRGRTNTSLFPSVEKLVGDRNAPDGYAALKGRTWDVAIDNPAQLPRWVREATAALKDSTERYVFVSTLSVFANRREVGMKEDGPLHEPGDPDATTVGNQYGPLKVRCEMEARAAFGDRALVVRPGLIVGPGDLTDRFSYWPVRIERGGEVLAPGTPDDPVAFVDARDLTEFMVRLCEQRAGGTYNCVGPRPGLTMAGMVYGIQAATTSDARYTWVDADFLLERKLRPYRDLPVWMPPRGDSAGWARMDCSKAIGAGLTFRPLADTSRATLEYYHRQPAERQAALRAGLSPEQEREVLAAWHGRPRAAE